jgi:hypothetical protein
MIYNEKLCEHRHNNKNKHINRLKTMAKFNKSAFQFENLIKMLYIKRFLFDIENEKNPYYEDKVLKCFRLTENTQDLNKLEFSPKNLDVVAPLNEIFISNNFSFSNYWLISDMESFTFNENCDMSKKK